MELFKHNQDAYKSALSMMSLTGKAAVVHPTGTGKSFIGLKLCEDCPKKIVCWISPSEYIFNTQIENWEAVGGNQLSNVRFFTYAKLSVMSNEEIEDIRPNYIVLDEFHRAGAEYWGKGVQRLLSLFPNAQILGLTATAIRYLDHQRNMVDELFNGNVASEMTLGEAIVRGILNPPKYVLAVYSLQENLVKIEQRVKRNKNKHVRDECEKYLEALRHTLEKADGLDVIFSKHIENRAGKYIVFCSGYEHMREMRDMVCNWVRKIDGAPHTYCAYSNDPETSTAFKKFKEDNSEHLKLLFCINMLNEGVHVEDVSGVILLRPTVSPIIYKQQIGRALSASRKTTPIIFDIVLNIENLYSIDTVEEEMKIATAYYRSLGCDDEIVNEQFTVFDEVRDCISLFNRLNETLGASWDLMYEQAKNYYTEYGNLSVPKKYTTEEGYSLGTWIFTQRNNRKNNSDPHLTKDRIKKLDEIGMVWESSSDLSWSKYFAEAEKYYHEFGNLDVPSRYVNDEGLALGAWIANLRLWEKQSVRRNYLTEERKEMLNRIGMKWSIYDDWWEAGYDHAKKYYKAHKNLNVASSYVDTEDGFRLGAWVHAQRHLMKGSGKRGPAPSPEKVAMLNQIGMQWGSVFDEQWEKTFQDAKEYWEKHGHLSVPGNYKGREGVLLSHWISAQRRRYQAGKLKEDRKRLLDSIGMEWNVIDSWREKYDLLSEYIQNNHPDAISFSLVYKEINLGRWYHSQIKLLELGKMPQERAKLISAYVIIGDDDVRNQRWMSVYRDIEEYYQIHHDLRIPRGFIGKSGIKLSGWLDNQRKYHKKGSLSSEKVQLLEKLHFVWEPETDFQIGLRHLEDYVNQFGNAEVLWRYVSPDGFRLGQWLGKQRTANKKGSLSIDAQKSLKALGAKCE